MGKFSLSPVPRYGLRVKSRSGRKNAKIETVIEHNFLTAPGVVSRVPKGRGRGRGNRNRMMQTERWPTRPGSCGSNTPMQSVQGSLQHEIVVPHVVPLMARLPPEEDVMWINSKGEKRKDRQVVGNKVVIRQQPAAVPPQPQVLVLADQMLERFQHPDKYMNVIAMVGHTINDYVRDIKDELIEMNYPYIIIFLGTMQLGVFDVTKLQQEAAGLVEEIQKQSPSSMIIFSGLVPRPLDHPRLRKRCENYSQAYWLASDDLRGTRGANCSFVAVYQEFLNQDGTIKVQDMNFEQGIYLSVAGIRVLRAAWLRFLGFFPQKAK